MRRFFFVLFINFLGVSLLSATGMQQAGLNDTISWMK